MLLKFRLRCPSLNLFYRIEYSFFPKLTKVKTEWCMHWMGAILKLFALYIGTICFPLMFTRVTRTSRLFTAYTCCTYCCVYEENISLYLYTHSLGAVVVIVVVRTKYESLSLWHGVFYGGGGVWRRGRGCAFFYGYTHGDGTLYTKHLTLYACMTTVFASLRLCMQTYVFVCQLLCTVEREPHTTLLFSLNSLAKVESSRIKTRQNQFFMHIFVKANAFFSGISSSIQRKTTVAFMQFFF